MTRRVALLADGGPDVGLGHLGRCSAIAAALQARGVEVACHAHGAEGSTAIDGIPWAPLPALGEGWAPETDMLILDSYTLAPDDRARLARRASLVALHDHGPPPAEASLLIASAAPSDAPGVPGPPALAGLRFAPLRAAYWGVPRRAPRDPVRRVLVSSGGGALTEAGAEAARVVRHAVPDATVALVRGPLAAQADAPDGVELVAPAASLLEELLAADLVVSAAGQTALEAAATGAPCVALPLVDNQRANARALAAAGAVRLAVSPGELEGIVRELVPDRAARVELARRAQDAVDGFGALRIAFALAARLET